MSNVFSGSKQRMAFTVREPIIRGSVRNVNVNGMMVWSSSTRKPVVTQLYYTVHAGLEKVPKYGVQSSKKKSHVTFEPWKQQWKVKTNNRISKFQYPNGHFMPTLKLYLYMHSTLFTEQYTPPTQGFLRPARHMAMLTGVSLVMDSAYWSSSRLSS